MSAYFQLDILLISAITIIADISHSFFPELSFFQSHQPFLYSPLQPPSRIPLNPISPISTTTEFVLPEVIINRQAKDPPQRNFIPLNHYLPPPADERPPPVEQDYPTPPSPVYLPTKQEDQPNTIVVLDEPAEQGYNYDKPSSTFRPVVNQPPLQIPSGLLPPVADTPVNDTPPIITEQPSDGYHYHPPGPAYLPPASVQGLGDGSAQIRLSVKEMRCLDHQTGFFRAVLKIESFLSAAPVVDNDSNDPKCDLKLNRSHLIVNIFVEDFKKCGVHHCGKDLCLRVRFPFIRGMRTGLDSILSLHCKTQNHIAAKTHALKLGVSNEQQSRSAGVYAHGGSQNQFRTHIELLRNSPNGYTKHIEPNGVVQLGEDLSLRAHVIAGDGWKYSKLTDVSLQRISSTGELNNSVNLITSRGCVNPSMRNVCPQVPNFEAPLGHRLLFKAVMFQGMRSGDEMVLSMRITGCLERQDCVQECNEGNFGRQKRTITDNSTEMSEVSKIAFRVELPTESNSSNIQESTKENDSVNPSAHSKYSEWVISGAVAFIGMLCLLAIFAHLKLKSNF